jgi:hypothetical protein
MATNLAAAADGRALALRPARVNIFELPGPSQEQAETDRVIPPPKGGFDAPLVAPTDDSVPLGRPDAKARITASALFRYVAYVASVAAVMAVLFVAIPTDRSSRGASSSRTPASRAPAQARDPRATSSRLARPQRKTQSRLERPLRKTQHRRPRARTPLPSVARSPRSMVRGQRLARPESTASGQQLAPPPPARIVAPTPTRNAAPARVAPGAPPEFM